MEHAKKRRGFRVVVWAFRVMLADGLRRTMQRTTRILGMFGTVVLAASCANYPDQLARAEAHYQNRQYGAAIANLEDLENHRHSLSRSERVRYDVARGLSHWLLEQREEARHWLAIAREDAREEPTSITAEQRSTIDRVLQETDPLRVPDASVAGDASAEAAR